MKRFRLVGARIGVAMLVGAIDVIRLSVFAASGNI
jgi:hypothetical protein